MPRARSNGLELEYETFGDPAAPPLLLISGGGAQMLFWSEEVGNAFIERGCYVIRFDNRDVGLSTKLDQLGMPDLDAVRTGAASPPYTLDDMAADTAGLLDALDLPAAHVVGISLGGYIGQVLAIRHSEKVLTLTSIGSGVGGADLVRAPPEEYARFSAPAPVTDREGMIDHRVSVIRLMSGPHFDAERVRAAVVRSMERSSHPVGVERQSAAIIGSPSRREALGSVRLPVLVIHGELDRLLLVENGRRTAAAIPGATLMVLPDMGHAPDPPHWPPIIDAITEHALRRGTGADRPVAASGH